MKTHTSEIKVALVGYVSVGKSTVLNALMGDKFSEVSMKRTTAAVNFFRIKQKQAKKEDESDDESPDEKSSSGSDKWSVLDDVEAKVASATHEEIKADNEILRSEEGGEVVEKYFDVETDAPIVESIRPDTNIILVDIPGINEAESRIKYKNYVASNWDTFDCVIVVMDTIQGVNTQEQIDILNFVKENNEDKKEVPTIILGNKADDFEDMETMDLVEETRAKCVEIFGDGCSTECLKEIHDSVKNGEFSSKTANTVFIPVSARDAFFYRKASHLTLETFDDLDKDMADKIGKDEVGRAWKKMTKEEKLTVIQSAVGTPEDYDERLASTNFGQLLSTLVYFVGTKDAQAHLLRRQIDVRLAALSMDESDLTKDIQAIYKASKSLDRPTDTLPEEFWKVYDKFEESTFSKITVGISGIRELARCFDELIRYHSFCDSIDSGPWKDEKQMAAEHIEGILRRQLTCVTEKVGSWSIGSFHFNPNRDCPTTWPEMSPEDWKTLLFSILLPSNQVPFLKRFGNEKMVLEGWLQHFRIEYNSFLTGFHQNSPYGGYTAYYYRNDMKPTDRFAKLKMPASPEDPSHWGYIGWKYNEFCQTHLN